MKVFFFIFGLLSLLVLFELLCSPNDAYKGCCFRHDGTFTQSSMNRMAKLVPKPLVKYNRKNWPHWIDEDGDCQDTRAEILIRDNIGKIKFKRNKFCNVSCGKWICPYTGKTFTKASDMDIDHIIPLAHAYKTGGANWSREKKLQFANDQLNLLAVDSYINRKKGDKSIAEWIPPRKEFLIKYSELWRTVKIKYGLKRIKVDKSGRLKTAIPRLSDCF